MMDIYLLPDHCTVIVTTSASTWLLPTDNIVDVLLSVISWLEFCCGVEYRILFGPHVLVVKYWPRRSRVDHTVHSGLP